MTDLVPKIDENKFMQQNKKNGQNHVHVLIVLGST